MPVPSSWVPWTMIWIEVRVSMATTTSTMTLSAGSSPMPRSRAPPPAPVPEVPDGGREAAEAEVNDVGRVGRGAERGKVGVGRGAGAG